MNKFDKIKLAIIASIFLLGLYFVSTRKSGLVKITETFKGNDCPNVLIKKGKELHLTNTKKAKVPGVNPIIFKSLEEYAEYVAWGQKVGLKCPILYYEETYNTQNEKGLRLLDNPFTPSAGLSSNNHPHKKAQTVALMDANRDDPPYNQNNYAGIDPQDQYVGVRTELDNIKLQQDPKNLTYAAPCSSWGGKCTPN